MKNIENFILEKKINKKGASEWTIGKLMSLILLAVFIALVIYGVATKALNPLIEQTQGRFDNALNWVKNLFGGNDDVEIKGVEINVPNVGIGIFNLADCAIDFASLNFGKYRINFKEKDLQGKFGRFEEYNEGWKNAEGKASADEIRKIQSLTRQLIETKNNLYINFEGGKKAILDSDVGIKAEVSTGYFGFGKGYDSDESNYNSVWLWRYNNKWEKITKSDIVSLERDANRENLINLHVAFKDFSANEENFLKYNEEKCYLYLSNDGKKQVLVFPIKIQNELYTIATDVDGNILVGIEGGYIGGAWTGARYSQLGEYFTMSENEIKAREKWEEIKTFLKESCR